MVAAVEREAEEVGLLSRHGMKAAGQHLKSAP